MILYDKIISYSIKLFKYLGSLPDFFILGRNLHKIDQHEIGCVKINATSCDLILKCTCFIVNIKFAEDKCKRLTF